MASKLKFNPEANKFEVIAFKPGKTPEGKSNLVGEEDGVPYLDSLGDANTTCSSMNFLLNRGYFSVLKCRECGQFFIFRKEESDWYEKMELEQPKRCRGCRKARERQRIRTSGELVEKMTEVDPEKESINKEE